ncbi:MAG TPA: hypothetical protein VJT73_20630, partial [Polyangiaceae bacterium]|nr:hypothetical protein [Polyangiaceae bacterium]
RQPIASSEAEGKLRGSDDQMAREHEQVAGHLCARQLVDVFARRLVDGRHAGATVGPFVMPIVARALAAPA